MWSFVLKVRIWVLQTVSLQTERRWIYFKVYFLRGFGAKRHSWNYVKGKKTNKESLGCPLKGKTIRSSVLHSAGAVGDVPSVSVALQNLWVRNLNHLCFLMRISCLEPDEDMAVRREELKLFGFFKKLLHYLKLHLKTWNFRGRLTDMEMSSTGVQKNDRLSKWSKGSWLWGQIFFGFLVSFFLCGWFYFQVLFSSLIFSWWRSSCSLKPHTSVVPISVTFSFSPSVCRQSFFWVNRVFRVINAVKFAVHINSGK